MYLHGHVHESNVAAFGRNKLWLVVGMCHAQRGGGGRAAAAAAARPIISLPAAAAAAAGDNR